MGGEVLLSGSLHAKVSGEATPPLGASHTHDLLLEGMKSAPAKGLGPMAPPRLPSSKVDLVSPYFLFWFPRSIYIRTPLKVTFYIWQEVMGLKLNELL